MNEILPAGYKQLADHESWMHELREWVASHPPVNHAVDDSRENIYYEQELCAIEEGLTDADAGHTMSLEEFRQGFCERNGIEP